MVEINAFEISKLVGVRSSAGCAARPGNTLVNIISSGVTALVISWAEQSRNRRHILPRIVITVILSNPLEPPGLSQRMSHRHNPWVVYQLFFLHFIVVFRTVWC